MHVAFILYYDSNIARCGAISGAASGASYFTSPRNIIVYASCNNIYANNELQQVMRVATTSFFSPYLYQMSRILDNL